MPNNSYIRSVKKERDLVNKARLEGCIAARSAGSKSPFDVYIVDEKNKVIRLIQVKTKKGCSLLITKDRETSDGFTLIKATYSYE